MLRRNRSIQECQGPQPAPQKLLSPITILRLMGKYHWSLEEINGLSWRWKLSQGEVLETEWTVLWRSLEQGGFPYADNFVLPSSETAISRRAPVMRKSR